MPVAGKVYGSETCAVPPAEIADATEVPISIAPAPEASVAFWKRLVNPAPVGAFPMFETVAEYVVETPTAEEVGETEPAVRSGAVAVSGTHVVPLRMYPVSHFQVHAAPDEA